MTNENNICSICGEKYVGYGHNAEPINKGRCCNTCNAETVIPTRIDRLTHGLEPREVPPEKEA